MDRSPAPGVSEPPAFARPGNIVIVGTDAHIAGTSPGSSNGARPHPTPAGQLLLDCLHQAPTRLDPERLARLSPDEWADLLALAAAQYVRPLVLRRLTHNDLRAFVPADVLASLKQACQLVATRGLTFHAELVGLAARLAAAGIPVIALKGMHVATAVYGNPGLREMGDIDLLVRREHLAQATSTLLSSGYHAPEPFDADAHAALHHHVGGLRNARGILVELHWNLSEPGRPYSIDPAELWDRAEPLRIGGSGCLALSREDLLLHLCLHQAYVHRFEFGIRSLCDLAELLRAFPDDRHWQIVRDRARAWHWWRGVNLTLRLAHDLLGALPCPRFEGDHPGEMTPALLDSAAVHTLLGPSDVNLPEGFVRARAGQQGAVEKREFPARGLSEPGRTAVPVSRVVTARLDVVAGLRFSDRHARPA